MSLNNATEIMVGLGAPYERHYPYGKVQPRSMIAQEVFTEASKWRSTSAASVTNIDAAKSAIYENGPALVAFPAYNSSRTFWKPDGAPPKGGHCVSMVGWTAEGFILRNSWGSSWGDGGYTIYPYADWEAHWEVWTVIDNESIHPHDVDPPGPVHDKTGCDCTQCAVM